MTEKKKKGGSPDKGQSRLIISFVPWESLSNLADQILLVPKSGRSPAIAWEHAGCREVRGPPKTASSAQPQVQFSARLTQLHILEEMPQAIEVGT